MIFKEVKVDNKQFKEIWIKEIESKQPCLSYEYLTFGNTDTSERDYYLMSVIDNKVVSIVYLSTLSHKILKIIKLKVLSLGSQITNGLPFWYDETFIDYNTFLSSLLEYINKNIKFQLMLLKDFKEIEDKEKIILNQKHNFLNFNTISRSYRFLDATFENYLENLNAKKRMFLKKEILKTIDINNLRVENIKVIDNEKLDHFYKLYKNVSLNAKEIRIEALPKEFFIRINRHFENLNYVVVFDNDKIIGFGILLGHNKILRCFCLGMDYSSPKKKNLWYVIVLESIKYSIENKYSKIEFGNSNYSMKRKFGAIEEKIIFSIKIKNKTLNNLLFPLLKKLTQKTFKTKNDN